jgi:hypothetical protein
MIPPLLCNVCGIRYWRNQQWIHDKHATNTAINERLTDGCFNGPARDVGEVLVGDVKGQVGMDPGAERGGGRITEKTGRLKTANRRSREAYNAYQREYMRKRRAIPPSTGSV